MGPENAHFRVCGGYTAMASGAERPTPGLSIKQDVRLSQKLHSTLLRASKHTVVRSHGHKLVLCTSTGPDAPAHTGVDVIVFDWRIKQLCKFIFSLYPNRIANTSPK